MYKQILEAEPANVAALARLAYLYEQFDSLDLAYNYARQIQAASDSFPAIDAAIRKLSLRDSLSELLFEAPNKNYLQLEYSNIHAFHGLETIFTKIFANGRVEFSGAKGDPTPLDIVVDKKKVQSLIKELQNMRFFTIGRNYRVPISTRTRDPHYYSTHKGTYGIRFSSEKITHHVKYYDLRSLLRQERTVTREPSLFRPSWYSNYRGSASLSKMQKLARFFDQAWWRELLRDEMTKRYGRVSFSLMPASEYVYLHQDEVFAKISLSELNIEWQLSINSPPDPADARFDSLETFVVNDTMYSLARNTKRITFKRKWNRDKYPFFRVKYDAIFLGRRDGKNYEVLEVTRAAGYIRRRVVAASYKGPYHVAEGEQLSKYEPRTYKDIIGQLTFFWREHYPDDEVIPK